MFGFGKRERAAARVTIETLYEAAVEVFNKSIAREDVTGRLNFEIGARTETIEKRGGSRHLAVRSTLFGTGHILESKGSRYDDAINILTVGIVTAVAMMDAPAATDANDVRTKAIDALNAAFRCDDVKAVVLAQLPPAMAMANRYDHFEVAREQLKIMAEQLARDEPLDSDAVKFLATLFVIVATVLTFGFATKS